MNLCASLQQEFLDAEGVLREDGARDAPTLPSFETRIARYRGLQEEVQALPAQASLGFIRADARPLRSAINTWISKWTFLFTRCLQDRVGGHCLSVVQHCRAQHS